MSIFRRIMLGGGIDIDTLPDTQKIHYKATNRVTPKSGSLGAKTIGNKYNQSTGEGTIICNSDIIKLNQGAFTNNPDLLSIKLPISINRIEFTALSGCANLDNICLYDNITYLGDSLDSIVSNLHIIITDLSKWCKESCNLYMSRNFNTFPKFDSVFYSTSIDDKEGIINLIIPEDISVIHNSAFFKCKTLETVIIPDNINIIGYWAFQDCTSLTSITIGNNVTEIQKSAFSGCTSLTSITIPDSVTEIGEYVFSNCDKLTSVTIGDSIITIGQYAFAGCELLKTIYINSLELWFNKTVSTGWISSNYKLYLQNKELTTIIIPNTILEIKSYSCSRLLADSIIINHDLHISTLAFIRGVFNNIEINGACTNGGSPFFESKIKNALINNDIGDNFFSDSEIEVIHFTSNSKNINEVGNGSTTTISTLIIDDGVETIKKKAFYYINLFGEVIIPDSVTDIGEKAFISTKINKVSIGESVTQLQNQTFQYCKLLQSVIIKKGVKSIYSLVFDGCTSMQYYDFSTHESVPTLVSATAFNQIPSTCKIIVPDTLYDEWIVATNWSTYADHIIKKSDWDASQTTE